VPEIVRDHNAHCLIIVREGHKLIHAIALGQPVRVVKLEKFERRYLTALELKGKPYPLARAIRLFKSAGKEHGITKGARALLNSLKEKQT